MEPCASCWCRLRPARRSRCPARGPLGLLVTSDAVGRGLFLVAPGIVFFALNKVLFAAINGRGLLNLYAGCSPARGTRACGDCGDYHVQRARYTVGGIFTIAEALLFPCLFSPCVLVQT